ncbi:S41 family peptidase [Candidatus Parcubacteria bacterium]|nr:S41 family peptidase [Candidatus Parcubacteria bacterium]
MLAFKRRKIVVGVALVFVIGVSFGLGYYAGHAFPDIDKVTSLYNKEPAAVIAPGTDFSPFWKAWNVLNEKFITFKSTTTDQEKVWGAIQGLAASFGDPYTVFFPPEEAKSFEASISGEFTGVGMEIGIRDKTLTVIAPLKDTPAARAGIKAGDKILKIDGTPTAEMTVEKAVSLIRGPKGTSVALSLFREGRTEPLDVKVTRDTIAIPTIDTEKREDGIFVIKLYSFSANSPSLFRTALEEFAASGSDKLILDLRNNPGGYLEAAVDMASWFLPAGKTVVIEESKEKGEDKVFRSKGYNIFSDKLKMVILVNQGSASASEILAGALSEHGIAKLVGERTFGKGSVQELVEITPDTSLKVTVARWLTPKGISISEGGLKPDVEVAAAKESGTTRDPQLDKAVQILLK